jgi:hypothetical protein
MSKPALYRLLTFHVPNLMSIFLSVGHSSKESVQAPGRLWHFVTRLFFMARSCWPQALPPAGGPTLVGCPRLLIQYIRCYLPYLEAVSSVRGLRKRHVVVTRDPPNMASLYQVYIRI